jgi:hypothetical protein
LTAFHIWNYEFINEELIVKDVIAITTLVVSLILFGSYVYTLTEPEYITLNRAKPIDVLMDPVQSAAPDTIIPIIHRGKERYTIIPQKRYQLSGIVVSYRRYRRGWMHNLSPWDYTVSWGNTQQYLPYVKFDQIVRFCLFSTKHPEKVDISYLESHIANNHLIPANNNLRKAMGRVKKKDQVLIDGFLVNVISTDRKNRIGNWTSSLTREDTGNGACEIIYVTRLRINNDVYE